jgi:hypothetical protein
MDQQTEPVRFYRVVEQARPPQPADRSAAGTLPTRATRYCDAVTAASGFGWWVFSPLDISLVWDGEGMFWTWPGCDRWLGLDSAQFPHLSERFDAAAPEAVRGAAPPFLTALPEPGCVQVWTGLFARTRPGWSLLVRPPANLFLANGYASYEGIVETDRWFGPLFTNLRLTRTDVPVKLHADRPLVQVQALPRTVYQDAGRAAPPLTDLAGFGAEDWADYARHVVAPSDDRDRAPGGYAVAARRRRSGCPMAGNAGGPNLTLDSRASGDAAH